MGIGSLFKRKKKNLDNDPKIDMVVNSSAYEPEEEGMEATNSLFNDADEDYAPTGDSGPEAAGPAPESSSGEMEISEPTDAFHNAFFDISNGHSELGQLCDLLAASAKGGLGKNSDKYIEVKQSLLDIQVAQMREHLGAEQSTDDIAVMGKMSQRYARLLHACQAYLNRRAHTKAGKARQIIVKTIQTIAERDAKGLSDAIEGVSMASQSDRAAMTWDKLTKIARTQNYAPEELHTAGGGQASEVYWFDDPDKKPKADGTKARLFFKPMDEYNAGENKYLLGFDRYMDVHPEERPPADEMEYIRNHLVNYDDMGKKFQYTAPDGTKKDLPIKDSKLGNAAVQARDVLANDVLKPMGLKDRKGLNMTVRNVATSRVAALLGQSRLIAKSTLAEVDDPVSGKKKQGIVMEGAEGISAQKYVLDARQEMIKREALEKEEAKKKADAEKNGTEYIPNPELAKFAYTSDKLDTHQGKNEMIKGTALRDLMNLQVLDIICGQVDRHTGNMFVQTDDDNNVIGITGIDNDSSFGLNTKASIHEDGNRHDRNVYDDDDHLAIPYVDADLAASIQSLNADTLRFALADLLDSECIEAAVTRLEKVKAAIGNAGDGQIISGEDWDSPQVRNDLMRNGTQAERSKVDNEIQAHKNEQNKLFKEKFGTTVRSEVSEDQRGEYDKITRANNNLYRDKWTEYYSNQTYLSKFNEARAKKMW